MGEWFTDWFDSEYYHLLYQNRDEHEAHRFIENLLDYLNLDQSAHILDLACGKGRHSEQLARRGYRVTGVDLSPNSISQAKQRQGKYLSFEVADMRTYSRPGTYNAICNLFTSFGYFDDVDENRRVLGKMYENLTEDGVLVIDFLNAEYAKQNLVPKEQKQIRGVQFDITRECDLNHFYKSIEITDGKTKLPFSERVQYIDLDQFSTLLSESGFELKTCFGNYNLDPFEPESPRLILVAIKA